MRVHVQLFLTRPVPCIFSFSFSSAATHLRLELDSLVTLMHGHTDALLRSVAREQLQGYAQHASSVSDHASHTHFLVVACLVVSLSCLMLSCLVLSFRAYVLCVPCVRVRGVCCVCRLCFVLLTLHPVHREERCLLTLHTAS